MRFNFLIIQDPAEWFPRVKIATEQALVVVSGWEE